MINTVRKPLQGASYEISKGSMWNENVWSCSKDRIKVPLKVLNIVFFFFPFFLCLFRLVMIPYLPFNVELLEWGYSLGANSQRYPMIWQVHSPSAAGLPSPCPSLTEPQPNWRQGDKSSPPMTCHPNSQWPGVFRGNHLNTWMSPLSG